LKRQSSKRTTPNPAETVTVPLFDLFDAWDGRSHDEARADVFLKAAVAAKAASAGRAETNPMVSMGG